MSDRKRLAGIAVFWLIVIRMAIGWHLMYEGLWKVHTLSTAEPWSSAGYLRNSQGPFRQTFRDMTGDPDELQWLDYVTMIAQWDDWLERFRAHHPDLTEEQLAKLDLLVNGPKEFTAKLAQLPSGVEIPKDLAKVVKFDADRKLLIVDGKQHLVPEEREQLLKLVADLEQQDEEQPAASDKTEQERAKQFQAAVSRIYQQAAQLSYKERLAVALKGNPDQVGRIFTDKSGNVLESSIGDIELYRQQIVRYEGALAKAEQDFQYTHLAKISSDLQQLRSKLVGPIKAMTKEMKREADQILDTSQLSRGPVPEPWTQIRKVDFMTIWGLVILGGLLIAGLFSRLSALGAAVLLFSFYLAMPPWPGVPEPPGPQHSLFINQHLIEVMMLLFLAMLPTGKWFGMDAFFRRSK
ncbi:MAG: hypothetical protein ACKVT0_00625 [Planctomycetaceae bacterium]